MHCCVSYSIYTLSCVSFISMFMSCAVVWMSQPRALKHSAHANVQRHVFCGLLSYPAGPACWQSGCLSSGSGTSPSRQTWSEAGRGHGAHLEISEKNKTFQESFRTKTDNRYIMFKLIDFILFWFHNEKSGQFFLYVTVTSHLCLFPLTWKASLFLRCRLLSLSRVFCFSSSSSFSRARMCSSKQIRASSLSISVNRWHHH